MISRSSNKNQSFNFKVLGSHHARSVMNVRFVLMLNQTFKIKALIFIDKFS